jgi:hypothetical protein
VSDWQASVGGWLVVEGMSLWFGCIGKGCCEVVVGYTDSPLIYPVLLGACALRVGYAGWVDVVSLYLLGLVHWHVRSRSDCVTLGW